MKVVRSHFQGCVSHDCKTLLAEKECPSHFMIRVSSFTECFVLYHVSSGSFPPFFTLCVQKCQSLIETISSVLETTLSTVKLVQKEL